MITYADQHKECINIIHYINALYILLGHYLLLLLSYEYDHIDGEYCFITLFRTCCDTARDSDGLTEQVECCFIH